MGTVRKPEHRWVDRSINTLQELKDFVKEMDEAEAPNDTPVRLGVHHIGADWDKLDTPDTTTLVSFSKPERPVIA